MVHNLASPAEKITRELGWQPQYTDQNGMREGLLATIKWYADVVQFDFERAIRVINAIPKLYR